MEVESFRKSQLFKALPFHTTNFLDNDKAINDFKKVEPRLAGLCDAVIQFDASIRVLANGDANFMKLLFFKKWFLPDSNAASSGTSKQNAAYAIEAILAHRLLETARIVYDPQPSDTKLVKSVPDPVKLMQDQRTGHIPKIGDAIEAFRSGPMKHMDFETNGDLALNIFEVCEEAKKLLSSHWKLGQPAFHENISTEIHWEDEEVDVRLWKAISGNIAQVEARSILLNIEIAATHIRLLITKGSLHTPPLAELEKTQPDCKDILSNNRFHRSLWIALSISPVFLLRKFNISKMFQLNTHNIFDFWFRSAMCRGDAAFLYLEKQIWRTLFEIALGQPTKSALEVLFSNLGAITPTARLVIPLTEGDRHARLQRNQKPQKRKANDPTETKSRKKEKNNSGLGKGIREEPENSHHEPSAQPLKISTDINSVPNNGVTNFNPDNVVTESSRTYPVNSTEDVSNGHGVNCSPVSAVPKTGFTGHFNRQSGYQSSIHSSNSVDVDFEFSMYQLGMPDQQTLNSGPSSDVRVHSVKANNQFKEKLTPNISKISVPLEASESTLNELLTSLKTLKVVEQSVVKKMEQCLAASLQVPVLISYIPQGQQEEGWPALTLEKKFESELYEASAPFDYLPQGFGYIPMAHSLQGLERIEKLFKIATFSHGSGASCIQILSRGEWNSMSGKDQQCTYSQAELVICQEHYSQPKFDQRLLLSIAGSSQQPIPIYDLSIKSAGINGVKKTGNIGLILAHSKEVSGSILYSLNIPSIGAGAGDVSPEEAVATDICAFQATALRQYCGFGHPYPSTSMRWSVCSLKHAATPFSWTHEGLGMYFQVVSGRQVIYVAKPIGDGRLAERSCFVYPDLSEAILNSAMWEVNAQVLEAGSICYIRPCRPYAFLNLEHTVCRGGFVYTWATIRDTCCGIYHSFFSNQNGLDTELIWQSRMLLRRVVAYYHMHYVAGVPQTDFPHHLPTLTTFTDVVSLLFLLNIVILGQIIYRPQYNSAGVSPDPFKEQLFAKGRQEAQELLNFLNRNYIFTLENRAVNLWQLFIAHLGLHVRCMVQHAGLSYQAGGIQESCSPKSLTKALSVYFSNKPWFLEELLLQQKRELAADTYAWIFEEQCSLVRRASPTVEAGMELAFPTEVDGDGVALLLEVLNKELEQNSVQVA